jgi:hypothetical protein
MFLSIILRLTTNKSIENHYIHYRNRMYLGSEAFNNNLLGFTLNSKILI